MHRLRTTFRHMHNHIRRKKCPGCTQRCHLRRVAAVYAPTLPCKTLLSYSPPCRKDSERAETVLSQPSCEGQAGWR
eukprot:6172301-Pleurochrysis_carterae.AAC.1